MEILLALAIGLLSGCGVYLVLRERTFSVILGLSLLSYAVNLFLFASGRLYENAPPIVRPGALLTDPLPQALVTVPAGLAHGMMRNSLACLAGPWWRGSATGRSPLRS